MEKGVIILEFDETKTDMKKRPPDFYRTGRMWVVTEAAIKRLYETTGGESREAELRSVLKARVLLLSEQVAKAMGFHDAPETK